jgi:hypothetical protein
VLEPVLRGRRWEQLIDILSDGQARRKIRVRRVELYIGVTVIDYYTSDVASGLWRSAPSVAPRAKERSAEQSGAWASSERLAELTKGLEFPETEALAEDRNRLRCSTLLTH